MSHFSCCCSQLSFLALAPVRTQIWGRWNRTWCSSQNWTGGTISRNPRMGHSEICIATATGEAAVVPG